MVDSLDLMIRARTATKLFRPGNGAAELKLPTQHNGLQRVIVSSVPGTGRPN